jgi:hypothetical protein
MNTRLIVAALAFSVATITGVGLALAGSTADLIAVLDGKSEVAQKDTPATGKAMFWIDHDYKKIEFKVTVRDIENVVEANIHLGKPGEEGPIIATLAGPLQPGKGPKEGVLAQGSFDAGDLKGPMWPGAEGTRVQDDVYAQFDELVGTLQSGGAYVNIRTDLGWAPAAPRAGNFTDGEIRGQIMAAPRNAQ